MAKTRKSKTTAAILAFIGGMFGVHRFYLGDTKIGVVFVFVLMTGILAPYATLLAGWIEAMRFLSMGQSEFDRKYNKHLTPGYRQDYEPRKGGKRVKKTQPTNYNKRENPYKKNGFKKYAESDLEGAIEDLEEALNINAKDKDIYFKLACAYSLMEKPKVSLGYLNEAIQYGYKDFDTISKIDDLAYLRISPEFRAYKAQGYRSDSQGQLSAPKKGLLQDDLLLAQLKKLSELRARGLLSETDYEREKVKLKTRKG